MTINRPGLKHHLFGIATAIVAFIVVIGGLSFVQSDPKNTSIVEFPNSYRAYSSNNYIGLARVGVAKAMQSNAVVKLGYSPEVLCTVNLPDEPVKTEPETQVQTVVEVSKAGSAWSGALFLAAPPKSLSEVCKNWDAFDFVITSSGELRHSLNEMGFKPKVVALGN